MCVSSQEELDLRNKTVYEFKMRIIRAKNMMMWWCLTKIIIRLWRAQWALHYRKESEKALMLKLVRPVSCMERFRRSRWRFALAQPCVRVGGIQLAGRIKRQQSFKSFGMLGRRKGRFVCSESVHRGVHCIPAPS